MLFIILFDRMTCYFMQLVGINSGMDLIYTLIKKKIRNQNTSNLIKSIHFTYENIIFQKISIYFKDANIINYILLK